MEGIGVAIGVPALIDLILRGGETVYGKVDNFRSVDETLRNFREVGLDIKQGTLYFALSAIKSASADRSVPMSIKDRLDVALLDLRNELASAQNGLGHVRENTISGKLIYTLWRGKGSKHRLDNAYLKLQDACTRLKDLCLQLHNFRNGKSPYHLTAEAFKIVHETVHHSASKKLPNSYLVAAPGNFVDPRHNIRVDADFLLETKRRRDDVHFLCARLNEEDLAGLNGIPPALGYRVPPYNNADGSKAFELVFKLANNTPRQSMANMICEEPMRDIANRLQLCITLSRAVSNLHSLQLIHKSINPRNLLATRHSRGTAGDDIWLHGWSYVREITGTTTQLGETTWQKAIYQHPERQGQYVDEAYQPKHDIYSLGVCVMEILLWTPFVISTTTLGAPPADEDEICDLFAMYGIARGDVNGGLPERYRGNSVQLASRPWATKAIWGDIAEAKLVNARLRQLVLDCLECRLASAADVTAVLETEGQHHLP